MGIKRASDAPRWDTMTVAQKKAYREAHKGEAWEMMTTKEKKRFQLAAQMRIDPARANAANDLKNYENSIRSKEKKAGYQARQALSNPADPIAGIARQRAEAAKRRKAKANKGTADHLRRAGL